MQVDSTTHSRGYICVYRYTDAGNKPGRNSVTMKIHDTPEAARAAAEHENTRFGSGKYKGRIICDIVEVHL